MRAPALNSLASLSLALLLASCATPPPLPEDSILLVRLMGERLALAREVAWTKFHAGLPVRDPEREAAVLNSLVTKGEAAGLDAALVARFARAQIEASCLEQETWIKKWRASGPPAGPPPDLASLRTRLDRISSLMLAEWAAALTTPPASIRAALLPSVVNPRSATIAASGVGIP